jgi:hypothetical protein
MSKPKPSFKSAVENVKVSEPSPEELAVLDGAESMDVDIPDWVQVPPNFAWPPGGRQVAFIRFRAEWTDAPSKGDRVCILWNLSVSDESAAIQRTRGEQLRFAPEMSKQMIRAVDGVKVDWSGRPGPGNPEIFWNEIGSKCRQLLVNHYVKTHVLVSEEQEDFLTNCVHVRTVG